MKTKWSHEELSASVEAYLDLQQKEKNGEKPIKTHFYRKLAEKYGRTENSFSYRFHNISYVLDQMGLPWVGGLKPLKNVGKNALKEIEEIIWKKLPQQGQVQEGDWSVVLGKYVIGEKPKGVKKPKATEAKTSVYERSREVKGWVLAQAKGLCECCGAEAPFIKENGEPYLEVHHVVRLSEGGSDTVENTVALCPNCHRELHFGDSKQDRSKWLYQVVPRLVREVIEET
ncbi:HNH endonuclease [Enterovibrio sp. ZSDZ42]|uniref:HNH endonuclease n=1 Tax=Enterovibrio gelatinilyticus TaxID=2899819 RepID=A0ABT5QYR9_9GAMM|nr:HNH endonuclease signature motif containing protein [Enterovibrio sp. ZSDZ42]MDD1792760.1 HNH endonuclease [Enterovibrio sp. ZSDZ42]